MLDSTASIETIIDRLEDILEERKLSGRRKSFNPANPYSAPQKDRRSGKDRRVESRN